MSIDITRLPEFGPALAEYNRQKQEAADAGDPNRLQSLELQWERTKSELKDKAFTRAENERARQAVLERVKREYPHAPEAVYASLGDPTAIEAAAKQAHEAVAAALPAQSQGQQAPTHTPSGQSWGPAPPTTGATPQPTDDPNRFNQRLVEIAPKASQGVLSQESVRANEELRNTIFDFNVAPRYEWGRQNPTEVPQVDGEVLDSGARRNSAR